MPPYRNRARERDPAAPEPAKPGSLSLLAHIARATVADGMQWPVLLCITVIAALYYYHVTHHESLAMLLATGVLVSGLLRGCSAWQQDLDEYQRQLAMARQQRLDSERRNSIPGYFPSRFY